MDTKPLFNFVSALLWAAIVIAVLGGILVGIYLF